MADHKKEEKRLLSAFHPNLIQHMKDLNSVIAGGAITSICSNTSINDYDIYSPDLESYSKILDKFKEFGYRASFETDNSTSLFKDGLKVQLIKTYYISDIEHIINKFDFTVCTAGYFFDTEEFVFHKDFFKDLAAKRLVINPKTVYPISTLNRVRKYIDKGYSISGIEFIKLALAINQIQLSTYKDLREHILGIDTLFLADYMDTWKDNETPIHIQETINNLCDL